MQGWDHCLVHCAPHPGAAGFRKPWLCIDLFSEACFGINEDPYGSVHLDLSMGYRHPCQAVPPGHVFGLTFSVTYWQRLRSWSPSGRISGSTIGTIPF